MSEKDADLLWELDQDPEVMRHLTNGVISSREKIDHFVIPKIKAFTEPEHGWGMWKVTLKESDEYCGWILIRPMEFFEDAREDRNLEIGWRLKQCYWGKGIATEAANQIKETLNRQNKVDRFSAIASVENHASIKIMKKLGLKYDKTIHYSDDFFAGEVVYYHN
nr:GNAT family N-acetyltransferase [Parashewanella tropica]